MCFIEEARTNENDQNGPRCMRAAIFVAWKRAKKGMSSRAPTKIENRWGRFAIATDRAAFQRRQRSASYLRHPLSFIDAINWADQTDCLVRTGLFIHFASIALLANWPARSVHCRLHANWCEWCQIILNVIRLYTRLAENRHSARKLRFNPCHRREQNAICLANSKATSEFYGRIRPNVMSNDIMKSIEAVILCIPMAYTKTSRNSSVFMRIVL